jgi:hypothetical protein
MKALEIKSKEGPEHKIQADIIKMMERYGWFCMNMHGNMFQKGVPDLFCCHANYGHRWVEVKLPTDHPEGKRSKFTPAQISTFPLLCKNGSPVWVLTAATYSEYKKLFKECNWHVYLMTARGV